MGIPQSKSSRRPLNSARLYEASQSACLSAVIFNPEGVFLRTTSARGRTREPLSSPSHRDPGARRKIWIRCRIRPFGSAIVPPRHIRGQPGPFGLFLIGGLGCTTRQQKCQQDRCCCLHVQLTSLSIPDTPQGKPVIQNPPSISIFNMLLTSVSRHQRRHVSRARDRFFARPAALRKTPSSFRFHQNKEGGSSNNRVTALFTAALLIRSMVVSSNKTTSFRGSNTRPLEENLELPSPPATNCCGSALPHSSTFTFTTIVCCPLTRGPRASRERLQE